MPNLSQNRVRFGPYEVDLLSGELRRNRVRLKLEGQPFQILKLLLERPGELITRDELRAALWDSDTFVDFEHGVNTAIRKLRQVLRDDADRPRYIQTIPRRGYRLICEVSAAAESEVLEPVAVEGDAVTAVKGNTDSDVRAIPARKFRLFVIAGVLLAAVCIVAAVFIYEKTRPRPELRAVKVVPFTTYPGYQLCPAFSPDGSRVAFAWNGDPNSAYNKFDLYVKMKGSENLLRLTHQPSSAICPAWSPDGTQLAFIRSSGSPGNPASVRLIPALGGGEKEILAIPDGVGVSMPPIWSPDGKWIVIGAEMHQGDSHWIRFISVDSGEVKNIPHAPGCAGEHWAAFSHSGQQWAYTCPFESGDVYGIFRGQSSGGPPTEVARLVARFSTKSRPLGLAWTADDKKLLLLWSRPDTGYEIDEVSPSDGSFQKLPFGENAESFALSAQGDRLVFVTHPFSHIGIWRKDLLHPETPAVSLLTSSQRQEDSQYSPDRKHLAFVSSRDGVAEVWMSDADGANLSKLSDPNTSEAGWPRWSPDSRKIAFSSHHSGHWEVYVVDIAERLPHKLVCNLQGMLVASWSHDGKTIYFQGEADDKVYRCPAGGGQVVAMSSSAGLNPFESDDGKTLYFVDRLNVSTLKSVSLQSPRTESKVPDLPEIFSAGTWALAPKGIYFVPAAATESVRFFDFATHQVTPVFSVANAVGDFAVTPDGQWMTYTQLDQDNANIMLVENFR